MLRTGGCTGHALLHTDLNNTNGIIGDDRAWIVDWGWATRGAPWLDAAYWVIWLIASGHHPSSAVRWAAKVPAW
jgi:aminoglycoside phosphotransferase (APT) family kinase protein